MDDLILNLPWLVAEHDQSRMLNDFVPEECLPLLNRANGVLQKLRDDRRNPIIAFAKEPVMKRYGSLRLKKALLPLVSIENWLSVGLPVRKREKYTLEGQTAWRVSVVTEEYVYTYLCAAVKELEAMVYHPELFETREMKEEFFVDVVLLLNRIDAKNKAWMAYKTSIGAIEHKLREETKAEDERNNCGQGRSPWTTWCRNRIENFAAPGDESKVTSPQSSEDRRVITSRVYLPRSCLWLSFFMSMDVRDIVTALMEIKDDPETRSQMPNPLNVYRHALDVQGQYSEEIAKVRLMDVPDEKFSTSTIGSRSITELAGLAARLENRVVLGRQPDYIGLRWERKTNLSLLDRPQVEEELLW